MGNNIREIRIYKNKAFKITGLSGWMPMKKAEAEMMIANESVSCVTYGPKYFQPRKIEVVSREITKNGMKIIHTKFAD